MTFVFTGFSIALNPIKDKIYYTETSITVLLIKLPTPNLSSPKYDSNILGDNRVTRSV